MVHESLAGPDCRDHHGEGQDDGASKVDRAASADAATGGHRRSILIKALHQDGTTRAGRPRRTGYKLVSEEPKVLR